MRHCEDGGCRHRLPDCGQFDKRHSGLVHQSAGSPDCLHGLRSRRLSDIPIAADMGADASKVLTLQLVRFVMGIGIFPSLIALLPEDEAHPKQTASMPRGPATGPIP